MGVFTEIEGGGAFDRLACRNRLTQAADLRSPEGVHKRHRWIVLKQASFHVVTPHGSRRDNRSNRTDVRLSQSHIQGAQDGPGKRIADEND